MVRPFLYLKRLYGHLIPVLHIELLDLTDDNDMYSQSAFMLSRVLNPFVTLGVVVMLQGLVLCY